jgi:type I restriction enzyme S subunit
MNNVSIDIKSSVNELFPNVGNSVPSVRFAGYTGEWTSVKISQIASFSKGQGYSKSDLLEKGTPIILYGRLYTKYAFIINKVDTFVDLKEGSVISEGNEVIIPASGETPEDIARASAVTAKGIILGGDLNIIRVDEKVCLPEFLALSITYGSLHNILSRFAQGKTVVHLHNAEIKNTSVLLPPTIAEQKDIVDYFISIDMQIETLREKVNKLVQIKQASFNKMIL